MELGSAITVSDPLGLSVSEYLTVFSVSRSRSSNRMCDFLASGFRTRDTALLHTVSQASPSLKPLNVICICRGFTRVLGLWPIAILFLYFQRCPPKLRSLRSTIITRFIAVGSEEAHLAVLTSVRLPNWTCRFPASSFHNGGHLLGCKEGMR